MNKTKQPTILSIDTSCDDTSVAVTRGLTVLGNVIASQTQLHQQYGGVFPTVAKQAHKQNLEPSIRAAMKRAQVTWNQIDAIAVTQGPGLAPALEVGINKAKELSVKHNKPLIAVNHIEGHVLSALAERNSKIQSPNTKQISNIIESDSIKYPISKQVLAIIVSGGHTEFILIKAIGKYERLGWTIDDAAGEALDKVGRILGLGYPAGPVIEKFAKSGNEKRFAFPLPMTQSKNFNLSFSGLKTFARRKIEELEGQNKLDKQTIYDFSASFQYAVFRHITYKLSKILKKHPDLGQVWLGGGVAANVRLREMIRQKLKAENQKPKTKFSDFESKILVLQTPFSKSLCSDNAAMIGIAGYFKLQRGEVVQDLEKLERQPRWRLT